jgi:hypothetical protein
MEVNGCKTGKDSVPMAKGRQEGLKSMSRLMSERNGFCKG